MDFSSIYYSDDALNFHLLFTNAFMLYALFWRARSRGISSSDLLSFWPKLPANAWGLLIAFTFIWSLLAERLQVAYFPEQAAQDLGEFLREFEVRTWPVMVFTAVAFAPFFEEIVFRRILLYAWSRTFFGFVGSALLSSGFWAGLHLGSPSLTIILFLEGVLLCLLARAMRSIWPGIVLHVLYNSYATVNGLAYVPTPP